MSRKALSKAISVAIIVAIVICIIAGSAYYLHISKRANFTTTTSVAATSATTSTRTSTTTRQGGAATTQYVVVVDARGKKVKIPEPVTRVIALYGMAPPFLYLLGVGNKFYGGWSWGEDFYKLVDPEFNKKIGFGRSMNVEEIVKVRPQLVIAATWRRFSKMVSQLESLGIPVVCIKIENINEIYSTISMFGKIFHKEKYANTIINYYKSIVNEVESKVKSVSTKPKVLILYYSGRHHSLRTFGGDMFQSKLVELAGGVNVAGNLSGKKGVNVEQVAKWNPDIILIIQYGVPASKTLQLIRNDPAWQAIKAVKDGKVYVVPYDGENWIDPCPKWALGLLWLGKVLHPQQFKDVNLTEVAAHFYKEFFNLSLSEVHITGNLTVSTAKG